MLCKPRGGLGSGGTGVTGKWLPTGSHCLLCQEPAGHAERRALWALWLQRDLIPKKGLSQLLLYLDYSTGRRAAKVALPTRGLGTRLGVCEPHTE